MPGGNFLETKWFRTARANTPDVASPETVKTIGQNSSIWTTSSRAAVASRSTLDFAGKDTRCVTRRGRRAQDTSLEEEQRPARKSSLPSTSAAANVVGLGANALRSRLASANVREVAIGGRAEKEARPGPGRVGQKGRLGSPNLPTANRPSRTPDVEAAQERGAPAPTGSALTASADRPCGGCSRRRRSRSAAHGRLASIDVGTPSAGVFTVAMRIVSPAMVASPSQRSPRTTLRSTARSMRL